MSGKIEIVIEKFDNGISVRWTKEDNCKKLVMYDSDIHRKLGETLWDEISKCYDSGASSDDDVIIEMKYEQ